MADDGVLEQLLKAITELNEHLRRLDVGSLPPPPLQTSVRHRVPVLDAPWMRVQDVVERAGSSRTEVLAALNDGSLLGYQNRAGGTWKVHRDDVDAWVRGDQHEP